jgi:urea transport system permease protein
MDLKNLFGEDFSLKQSTIAKIVDAPPEIASNIFFALQDENVFLTNDQLVVLKANYAYVDAITNTTVTVDETKLESPTLNNSIRSDIESAVSQYKL